MLGLATRCCICTMQKKRSTVLENAAGFARLDAYIYIWCRNKKAALRYVYTLGKQTLRSTEHCTSQDAACAKFLEVQIPLHVLVYDWDP